MGREKVNIYTGKDKRNNVCSLWIGNNENELCLYITSSPVTNVETKMINSISLRILILLALITFYSNGFHFSNFYDVTKF